MNGIKRILSLNSNDITIKRIFFAVLRRIKSIPNNVAWVLPLSDTRKNKQKIQTFHNVHKEKRCFIIANGPSLKVIDFSLLENEITIGMNRIYLMKKQNGFMPTYLVCIDKKSQLLQFHKDFDQLEIPSFFEWDLRRLFSKKQNQHFIKGKFNPNFSINIVNKPMGNGRSVTYACMQLAYYMGFKEVYLIGKDHSYNTTEKAGSGIKSTGNEGNHFIKGYYKKGQKWDAPDYKSEEFAYKLARKAFEKDGRVIKDATINGKLDVFEKMDFFDLFN